MDCANNSSGDSGPPPHQQLISRCTVFVLVQVSRDVFLDLDQSVMSGPLSLRAPSRSHGLCMQLPRNESLSIARLLEQCAAKCCAGPRTATTDRMPAHEVPYHSWGLDMLAMCSGARKCGSCCVASFWNKHRRSLRAWSRHTNCAQSVPWVLMGLQRKRARNVSALGEPNYYTTMEFMTAKTVRLRAPAGAHAYIAIRWQRIQRNGSPCGDIVRTVPTRDAWPVGQAGYRAG